MPKVNLNDVPSLNWPDDFVITIDSVDDIEEYQLNLQFSDGTTRVVDFGPFLRKSHHPQIRAYLDIEKFKAFTLDYGDLMWDNYDLCFPIADLYANRL